MIQVAHLTKRYGSATVVDDVSFDVPDNSVFCLLGPNGSGKTTTLRMLAGLARPTSGTIFINNHPVTGDAVAAKRELSYLPQRTQFPENLTGTEVLRYYARLRGLGEDVAQKALSEAGLDSAGARPVREFSGGMTQRLGLAIVTMSGTPILLLDEPTASLDPEGVVSFREFIQQQKSAGKTVVFSTHLLTEAEKLADLVAIYLGGKLVTLQEAGSISSKASAFQTMEEFYLHYVGGSR